MTTSHHVFVLFSVLANFLQIGRRNYWGLVGLVWKTNPLWRNPVITKLLQGIL